MKWTEQSLKNPAAVAVIAVIIILLGAVTVFRLPVQLFPDIDRPQISVNTGWRAASPQEVESEITEPVEEVLQGIPGLEELVSNSNAGGSNINLTFALGSDMNKTLLEVISRLNRLRPLPADSDPPTVQLGGFRGDAESLIWYFVQTVPGNPHPMSDYSRFIEDVVVPRIESIPGVSGANFLPSDGQEELQVIFDPYRAAELGIDLTAIPALIGNTNDVSGGFTNVGRRQYTIRFEGRYDPIQLGGLILDWRDGTPILLGDIAEIRVGPGRRRGVTYQNGNPASAIQMLKDNSTNVLATLKQVKAVADELNETVLKEQGLRMEKSFDPSVFIMRAINLLTNNLIIGVLLAVGILWWFLRHGRATLLIALAIPISIFATFIFLGLAGRSLNAISLAGLAFATGMVLDAAIVVLENVVRLREKGLKADDASNQGASQVWGALIASTATTVAIFLPVLFLKDVEGQLFADLALTIAIGVTISLVVAATILPTAAKVWLKKMPPKDVNAARWDRISGRIMRVTDTNAKRVFWIAGLITIPLIATWLLLPPLNYLPPVKRDAVDTNMLLPAGVTLDFIDREYAQVVNERLLPYLEGEKEPKLLNFYFVTFGANFGQFAARAEDQDDVEELMQVVREEIAVGLPDLITFTSQSDLFGGFGSQGNIALHIQSSDPQALRAATQVGLDQIREKFDNANVNPQPDPNAVAPEIRMIPNDNRIREAGWNRQRVASIVRALGDGLWLGEYFDGEKRLDVILKAEGFNNPEELQGVPLATPAGGILPLGEVVDVTRATGPVGIRRFNGRRTITLQFSPPPGIALEDALAILRNDVEPLIRAALPADGNILYGGSADSMNRAIGTLGGNFLLALGLLFLIMAALFKSVKDSLLVVISIPLATVGGVAALRILNLFTFQPMDLLTMIGFIILLGLVVNNAILLVVRTRQSEEEGLNRRDAVAEALRLRLRPIFMSTLTSIFGMLPLVLFPGIGSAIYRGMAAAIAGGMSISMVFTLILLPSLLQLTGKSQSREADTRPLPLRRAAE